MQSFNEGGADCPPIGRPQIRHGVQWPSFNEGGADCPPIEVKHGHTAYVCGLQ